MLLWQQVTGGQDTLIIAPSVFHSTTTAVYTISLQQHSDSSPKLDTVHFISSLTGQSSQLTVFYTSPTPNCVSQSPSSTLHKVPVLQQVSTMLGEEVIVVMVTVIVVLLGFVAVCCSLWRHGNSGSTSHTGFLFHMQSAASPTPQPLPSILMSSSGTPPGSSPRQSHHRTSAFTPTNNSPHYTPYNQ